MNVTGIIAEYNPFHLGHLHQIAYVREKLNSDYIIVAMSGDFVQREPLPFSLNTYGPRPPFCAAQILYWSCLYRFLLPVRNFLQEELFLFLTDQGSWISYVSEAKRGLWRECSWPPVF